MNEPSQIREVYKELRRAFGDDVSAAVLLRLAAHIVHAAREPKKLDPSFRDGYRHPTFFSREVDRPMDDGGWRVMDYERRAGMQFTDDLPENYFAVQARIHRLVGRLQWPITAMD
jgi:hypothetical protein